jgi:hypothetical protein
MSRQHAWQRKRVSEGKCRTCGGTRTHYASVCDTCQEKERERGQRRTGSSPWRPGGPGRPPKTEAAA